jgi:hypothetical protein
MERVMLKKDATYHRRHRAPDARGAALHLAQERSKTAQEPSRRLMRKAKVDEPKAEKQSTPDAILHATELIRTAAQQRVQNSASLLSIERCAPRSTRCQDAASRKIPGC